MAVATQTLKCPFPWFGGKARVAPIVWLDHLKPEIIGGHDYVPGSDVQIAVDRWHKDVRTFEDYSWLKAV